MAAVRDLINPGRLTRVVNVGASPMEGPPFYRSMMEEGLCEVIGFEPNPQELAKLNATKGPNERYLPHAIGAAGERLMHVCVKPGFNSLLEPDTAVLAAFEAFSEWATVTETTKVATTPLSAIPEIEGIDLLCMDVQGSEMEVMASGHELMTNAVAVLTEVAFVPLYQGQPAFGHVDVVMRQLGFLPHCFAETKMWPIKCGARFETQPHQILEADILYVRDYTRFMSVDMWRQLAMVSHYLAGSPDLTMRCIYALERAEALPDGSRKAYLALLENTA